MGDKSKVKKSGSGNSKPSAKERKIRRDAEAGRRHKGALGSIRQ